MLSTEDQVVIMNQQIKAFLDMLAWAEIGPDLLAVSDNGYNVIVGSTPERPVLFSSYADHPRKYIKLRLRGKALISSAAGRYQILCRNYDHYKKQLGLKDFSPGSQDKIARQLILECHAVDDIIDGYVEDAINACRSRWASLPGAGYAQPEKKMADLLKAFEQAGGTIKN